MRAVLSSLLLPLGQVDDPAFRAPLLKGVLGAAVAFAALVGLTGWGASALAGGTGWLAGVAAALGGALALLAAVFLFVPVVVAISGVFLDEVAAAVERRHYPALPPANGGASLAAQLRYNLGLAARVLGLTLLALPLALALPPVGAVALWAVGTLALGAGLFEGVAQRRVPVPRARALYRSRRWAALAVGGALSALALVPVANLLVPVLGAAAMTHLLHRGPGGPVAG